MKTEFGGSAFSAASQIWNQIPLAIRTLPSLNYFKHHLKTNYFTIAWDSNPRSDCLHLSFKFILNAGTLTNLLRYITYDSMTDLLNLEVFDDSR